MPESKEVAIDARWLHTGLGTYTYNLLAGLGPYIQGLKVRCIVRSRDVLQIAPLCNEVRVVNAPLYSLREQIQVPLAARGAHLLHVPHYNVPLFYRGKLIVTIHDLIHLGSHVNSGSARSWAYAWPMLKMASRKAGHIITVSEYSKMQIVERLGVAPERVTVIYNGVGTDFHPGDGVVAREEVSRFLGVNEPFLLFVGNLKPHKNLGCLLRAFANLCTSPSFDRQLVIVGQDLKWGKRLVEESRRLRLEGRVFFVPHASVELLHHLYTAADLFVMPSLIEGFGLPVLEAMASGTPVICARASALPEVGGEAVEYFDPSDAEDLAVTIERVLGSPDLQANLRRKGLERASRFTWQECAQKHCEIYRCQAA
jgi:glycosyltransferase involved in cell wall biosynthesis